VPSSALGAVFKLPSFEAGAGFAQQARRLIGR